MNQRNVVPSLPLDRFWSWLNAHHNCILRAGGGGFLLFDQPDFHWHLGEDLDGNLIVQLVRGKELCGEMMLSPAEVMYVQASPDEGEQTLFELIGGTADAVLPICYFLMAHPFDEEEETPATRWTH